MGDEPEDEEWEPLCGICCCQSGFEVNSEAIEELLGDEGDGGGKNSRRNSQTGDSNNVNKDNGTSDGGGDGDGGGNDGPGGGNMADDNENAAAVGGGNHGNSLKDGGKNNNDNDDNCFDCCDCDCCGKCCDLDGDGDTDCGDLCLPCLCLVGFMRMLSGDSETYCFTYGCRCTCYVLECECGNVKESFGGLCNGCSCCRNCCPRGRYLGFPSQLLPCLLCRHVTRCNGLIVWSPVYFPVDAKHNCVLYALSWQCYPIPKEGLCHPCFVCCPCLFPSQWGPNQTHHGICHPVFLVCPCCFTPKQGPTTSSLSQGTPNSTQQPQPPMFPVPEWKKYAAQGIPPAFPSSPGQNATRGAPQGNTATGTEPPQAMPSTIVPPSSHAKVTPPQAVPSIFAAPVPAPQSEPPMQRS